MFRIKDNRIKYFTSIILLCILISCSSKNKQITKLDDAANSKIGVMTGTTGEQLAIKRFPNAEVKSFDDIMDAVAALKSGQINAVITGYPAAMNVSKRNDDLFYLDEAVDYENTAIAIRKGNPELLNQLNNFITELKNNGTLADMKRRWFKTDFSPYEVPNIEIPEKGEVLKVGVSATREPFCFLDADKNVSGHDGELARRVSVKLNRPIQFVDMKFSALITALQSGKIDIIITGMTATEERSKSVDFTESYFLNSQVMLVKKGDEDQLKYDEQINKLSSVNDVKDKKIGVLLGSVHDTYAIKNYPNATILQYKSPSEILLAVKSQKVDAAFYTTETLREMIRSDNEIKILGDTLFAVPIGMGFNKENTKLREQFNSFLRLIKSNGEYQEMVNRWLINGEYEMPELKKTITSGTLVVGTVSDKGLPFTVIQDGKMIGFDIELVERFASHIGKELKLVDMEFGSLIIAAASKKIDMIASTLMITEERKKQIDFSDVYYKLGASIFALSKNISEKSIPRLKTLDDIADKKVGVYAGTVHDGFVMEKYPKAEIFRYNSTPDMILALKTGKIDVSFFDYYSAGIILKDNEEIGILSEEALDLPLGIGFSKNKPELTKKFNNFLKMVKANGKFDEMYKKWFQDDIEKAKMPEFPQKQYSNKLTLGVSVADLPYSAFVNGEYVGFDIELLKTFADHENIELKIITMDFSALVAALAAGKVDMIADGISITEERARQVDFSDKYLDFRTAVLALKSNMGHEVNSEKLTNTISFFESIRNSFTNNIIVEKRYLLIIDGLRTTAIISLLSILFGSILGSFICYMRMAKKKILLIPAKIYISLLRGTPVLVVLMIIFYVVFASVDIDPVIVAVVAFGMNFAAYVSEMFRTGIEGVDSGQSEAGIAMGFTKIETFIFIVLPQAARRILTVYKGEVISLVKMTSIVGYIAVQDLTKASDIIRSRTFDAFFPLIMVAVLYFLISWLLMLVLGYVERLADPKTKLRRSL
ncbi:MAG: ABC transporter permease subunit [Melioribacteraceae bacterium]|nr:ABC transporter permease subunit [Melioribacteraceae bacterium]